MRSKDIKTINELLRGLPSGLKDSDGRMINFGDTVRYEYRVGFNWIVLDGKKTKIQCFPFDEIEDRSHETKVLYEVHEKCAGAFLDLPTRITQSALVEHTKFYVVEN